MKKIAFVFIAAMTVLSFGCKKKNDMKEAMAKMEGFKTAMCACKAGDKACAEKVGNDMKAYTDSMKGKEGNKDMKPSAEDEKKMMAIVTEMGKCQTAAMTDPAAAAPPPAGDPAGAAGGTMPAGSPPPAGGDSAAAAGTAPPAGGAAPPAGGDMKKEEPKKDEPKKEEMKK